MTQAKTIYTDKFKRRMLKGGLRAKDMIGKGLVISYDEAPKHSQRSQISISVHIVNEKGKRLAEIVRAELNEGDTVTVLKLDQPFNIFMRYD
jgi:hypothetical protein